jgi:hypothetical protein
MILIELDGERQLVESLDGYAGWAVIEKDVDLPPSDYCARVDGAWVEDTAAKDAGEQAAALEAMSKADLLSMIDAKIAVVSASVDSLATQVGAVNSAPDVGA